MIDWAYYVHICQFYNCMYKKVYKYTRRPARENMKSECRRKP